MTKDEFAAMVDTLLSDLRTETVKRRQNIEKLRKETGWSEKLQREEYLLEVTRQKYNQLNFLIALPAYARIQAMSDAEIEEYKQSKAQELELKINEIESRKEQKKAEAASLQAEYDRLISQLGSLTGSRREEATRRAKIISERLSSALNVYSPNSVFAIYESEIEQVRRKQEKIKSKTSQEIKEELSSKVELKSDIEWAIKRSKGPFSEFEELQLSVASDPEKARQMAKLLAQYTALTRQQHESVVRVPSVHHLPQGLYQRLRNYYEERNYNTRNPNALMETIEKFEGDFELAKASFMEEFTEQKLARLVGREEGQDSSEVDMEFLQLHADKVGDGELSHVQALVEQRDKLSKKLFKTGATKAEIASLNYQIMKEQSKICKEVIGWYKSQSKEILGITSGVQFHNLTALISSLEQCRGDISRSEQAIIDMKENVQRAEVEKEQQTQAYETKRTMIAQQMRDLAGEKHKETAVPYDPYGVSENSDANLNRLAILHGREYGKEVIGSVLEEAQNQADIRESELTGIPVEQIIANRQQATEPIEEAPHGIKK